MPLVARVVRPIPTFSFTQPPPLTLSAVKLTGTTFLRNQVTQGGGGAMALTQASHTTLASVALQFNSASLGGAIVLFDTQSVLEASNLAASNNVARLGNGGALLIANGDASLISSVLSNNVAANGYGGIY